jgi:DNA-binding transcriptional LysR family regulator
MNFDWNNAKAFLATAQQGSFSAAAKALELTQPTVGRQVSALEKELNVALFERIGKKLHLTKAGQELLKRLAPMNEAAIQASITALGHSEVIEGRVTIAASQIDALYRLPAIIAQLRQQAPKIQIDIVVSNEVSDLQRGEADIAIRSFRPTQPELIAKKIRDIPVWLYGSRRYLSASKQYSLSAPPDFIGFDRSSMVSEQLSPIGWNLQPEHFPIATMFQPLHIELAKRDLGVIFLPADIGEQHPDLIKAFESLGTPLTLEMWLVCHQELRTNKRVRTVFDCLAGHL